MGITQKYNFEFTCDNKECGKKETLLSTSGTDIPKEWFLIKQNSTIYLARTSFYIQGAFCSRECLRKYLFDIINQKTLEGIVK